MTIANRSEARVFLSASIPPTTVPELRKKKDAWEDFHLGYYASRVEIEAAVHALATQLLGAKKTLVFGGHPEITPIITDIGRRVQRTGSEISIEIYQSAFFAGQEKFNRKDRAIYRHIQWTPICKPSDAGPELLHQPFEIGEYPLERADHGRAAEELARLEETDEREWLRWLGASLEHMRQQMIPSCQAGLFVGGMQGIEDELDLFENFNPGRPVWLIARPGGRTDRIAATREPEPNWHVEKSRDYDAIAFSILGAAP